MRNNGHGQAGKTRGSCDNDLLDAIKEAMQHDNVVAGLAKRIAAVVTETNATRMEAMDTSLRDKQLEGHVKRVDVL